jgi:hypothetical protein
MFGFITIQSNTLTVTSRTVRWARYIGASTLLWMSSQVAAAQVQLSVSGQLAPGVQAHLQLSDPAPSYYSTHTHYVQHRPVVVYREPTVIVINKPKKHKRHKHKKHHRQYHSHDYRYNPREVIVLEQYGHDRREHRHYQHGQRPDYRYEDYDD